MADIKLIVDTKSVDRAIDKIDRLRTGVGAASKAQKEYTAAQKQEQAATKAYAQARREATEANARFDAQQRKIAQVQKEAADSARKQAQEITRLRSKYVEGYGASQKFKKEIRDLIQAKRKGIITTDQYGDAVQRLKADFRDFQGGVVKGSNQFASYNTSVYKANQRTKRFASVGLQQAGYQVGDFAVQLQGGTNAAVAFGQQGSQLLGIFGAFGAVMGAVLAVTTAIVAPMLDSAEAGGKMSEEFSKLGDQLQTIEPILTSIKDGLVVLKEFAIDAANVILNNLDRIVVYGATVASFFAGKWVAGFVKARFATLGLAGAIGVLKKALLRFLPTAVLIAVGELVFLFVKLVKGAGSFGEALKLLTNVASGVWTDIGNGARGLWNILSGVSKAIQGSFVSAFAEIGKKWDALVNGMAAAWNTIAETQFGETLGFGKMGTSSVGSSLGSVAEGLRSEGISRIERGGELLKSAKGLENTREAVDKLREAMSKADEEGKRIDIRDWLGLGGGSGEDGDSAGGSGGSSAADDMTRELTKVEENIQSVADTMKNSMSDAFMSMVEGTKSFKDAMREMARAVIKQLFDILVVQQLVGSFDVETGKGSGLVGGIMKLFTGGFANGAAFSNGKVTAFADGGVVNQPTMFPMANGAGLMGEAGPEAIMPLKRGKNGKLGVQVEGNSQQPIVINQSFNFSANGDESVKRIIAQEAPKIANLTQKQILDQRARGGAFKTTFG